MRSPRAWRAAALAAPVVVVLAACTGTPPLEPVDSEPLAGVLEPVSPAPALPPDVAEPEVLRTPFGTDPVVHSDGVVGAVFPTADEVDLRITAVAEDGRRVWQVRTNPSCAGFAVTSTPAGPVAVVLHSDADLQSGRLATRTTASGYRVTDGRRIWGPVEVPGPLQGPGLLFGEAAVAVVGGSGGPRAALDGGDGSLVETSGEPVAEHDGTVLTRTGDGVTAVQASTGDTVWSSAQLAADRSPGATAQLEPGTTSADGSPVVTLRWSAPGAESWWSVQELATGRTLVPRLPEPPREPPVVAGDLVVVVTGPGRDRLVGWEAGTGRLRWEVPAVSPAGWSGVIAGRGRLFARDGDGVALDLAGRVVARGAWLQPEGVTGDGAMLLARREPGEVSWLLAPAG